MAWPALEKTSPLGVRDCGVSLRAFLFTSCGKKQPARSLSGIDGLGRVVFTPRLVGLENEADCPLVRLVRGPHVHWNSFLRIQLFNALPATNEVGPTLVVD